MTAFKKTEILRYQHFPTATAHNGTWARWDQPITLQEYGAINRIDISRQSPNYLAITSYSKVSIYNPQIKDVHKTISLKDEAFGATFRRDGKLLVVGATDGQVKVYDVATKTLLRVFRGHAAATHRCNFLPDTTRLVSFSDDKSVGLWDLPAETLLTQFQRHTDYVRCGCSANVNADLFVSGSYDQTVMLWDRRVNEPVLTIKHEAPVEDVVMLPGDGIIVSAAGNCVKVWDITGGGKPLASLSPHHKTVTCLSVAGESGAVVSGSLDRHAKRIDMKEFRVTGDLSFPNSLVSVAVDFDDRLVCGGMIDGLVQICTRREEILVDGQQPDSNRYTKKSENLRYLKYTTFTPMAGDVIVDKPGPKFELKHDTFLRKYEYSRALDVTLKPAIQRTKPQYAHSVLYELMRRDGLKIALAGRDEKSILLVLTYLKRYLNDVRFSEILLYVADLFIDLYFPTSFKSEKVAKMFTDLHTIVKSELSFLEALTKLQGNIELIMSSALAGKGSSRIEKQLLDDKVS